MPGIENMFDEQQRFFLIRYPLLVFIHHIAIYKVHRSLVLTIFQNVRFCRQMSKLRFCEDWV